MLQIPNTLYKVTMNHARLQGNSTYKHPEPWHREPGEISFIPPELHMRQPAEPQPALSSTLSARLIGRIPMSHGSCE